SFTIARGEFVALTGPSGSGKTTLLSLIGGLDRPSAGEVRVAGRSVRASGTALRRDTIGIVLQHHHLLPRLSALANIELALIGAGVGRRARRERATALLDEVGLAD